MKSILNQCRKINLILVGIVWLLLQTAACAQTSMDKGYNPEYDVGFLNKMGHDLDEVSAYYTNNTVWVLGTPLVTGGESTEGWIPLPIPAEAEVRIVDKGVHKAVKVSLKDVPKKGFRDGTIYFVFNADGTVQVKPLKENDEAGYAELIKGLRPEGEYRFGFVNKTGHDIESVSVNQGATQISRPNNGSGDIPVRVKFEYSEPLLPPIPSEVEVRWSEENGTPHAVKVKLDGVPKGFEGRIFFVINPDHTVEVHPIKNGNDKAAFKVVK
jgi:hypothetical protein